MNSSLPAGGRPINSTLTRLRLITLLAGLALASSLLAQNNCSEEVKLVLSPPQAQAAVQALHAHKETHGHVYFYDTPALDLLSQGMILRLRTGGKADLTTKFRPPSRAKFVATPGERYECEIDRNNDIDIPSFALQNQDAPATAPHTGEELLLLLNGGQKQLLKDSKVRIDWKRVTRIADIQSTSWTTVEQPSLGKLSLELWEWPNGSILELSGKVTPGTGHAAYIKLQNLAKSSGLTLNAVQSPKTSTALKKITAAQR